MTIKSTPCQKFLCQVWFQTPNQMLLIVAILIRLVGDFDVAEEAAQEAFTAAVNQWQSTGIPDLPRAWIILTARYKAIDRPRRRTRLTEKMGLCCKNQRDGRLGNYDQKRTILLKLLKEPLLNGLNLCTKSLE